MVAVKKRRVTTSEILRQHKQRLHEDRESMNMKHYRRYRPNWDWKSMIGSAACIKWCFRDLRNLDAALELFTGREVAIQAGGNIGIFAKRLAEEFKVVQIGRAHV